MKPQTENYIKFSLLSIDAWRDEGGWYWNNVHYLEREIYILESELTPRKIARMLRDKFGVLSEHSKGRIRIDMHPEYMDWFIEICAKGTGEPIFALSTIHGE